MSVPRTAAGDRTQSSFNQLRRTAVAERHSKKIRRNSTKLHAGTCPLMRKLLGVTLGIMTALGGFVDFGQIVFTMQAGALFEYHLLWAIAIGTVAIIVYM